MTVLPSAPAFDAAPLDAALDAALAARQVVGSVVEVVHRGQRVYQRAAGWADREAGRAMTPDTLFRLASITKPMVSALTLALVRDGVLGLDDPVTRWLPDFQPEAPDGTRPPITLRQLLTHTAGLSYSFQQRRRSTYVAAGVSDGLDDPPGLTLEENVRRLAGVPLLRAPGSGWQYSIAIDVLGLVLERATGLRLPELIATRLVAPLGLVDTGFWLTDPARQAVPYCDAPTNPPPGTDPATLAPKRMDDTEPVPYYWLGTARFAPTRATNPDAYASAGSGLCGPMASVVRFLEAMRQGGAPLLSAADAESMRTHQIGALRVDTLEPGWGFGYGAAVLLDPTAAKSPQSAGTWHWVGIYGHSWFVDPVRELTVVALTNTALAGMGGPFPTALRDAVYAGLAGA